MNVTIVKNNLRSCHLSVIQNLHQNFRIKIIESVSVDPLSPYEKLFSHLSCHPVAKALYTPANFSCQLKFALYAKKI
jgi:hypothetical protein